MKKTDILIYIILVFLLLLGFTAVSCSDGGGGDDNNDRTLDTYSQVVGPEGGTVTDPRGASVVIPAGALNSDTTITITTYTNAADIELEQGVTPFSGGADFGPDGITFNLPVTVYIPSSTGLVGNQEHSLMIYEAGSWQETDFTAVPGTDTNYLTADVTHFTPYVCSLYEPGLLSGFEDFYSGGDAYYPFMYFVSWFLDTTGIYGYSVETDDANYECIGVFFDLSYTIGGFEGEQVHAHGECVNSDAQTILSESSDYTVNYEGADKQVVYNLSVQIHWSVTNKPEERPMSVCITEPLPGTEVDGLTDIYTFTTKGTDTITGVQFFANGSLIGEDTDAPYSYSFDTGGYSDGEITLTAKVNGQSGNSENSDAVVVHKGTPGQGGLGSWNNTSSFNVARSHFSSVIYNGYIYVLGGRKIDFTELGDVQYARINPNGSIGTWSSTTSFPTARTGHQSVVYNGYIYILGGVYDNGTSTIELNDVQYAKINTDGSIGSWNSTAKFETKRSNLTSVVYNGYIYVLGGRDNYDNRLNSVEYARINTDGSLGDWTSTTSFTTGRNSHTSVVYNGYIYILGGSGPLDDVQYAKINTDGSLGSWSYTTSLNIERWAHSSVVYNGYIYILGGSDGTYSLNDVQYAEINTNGSIGVWSYTTSFNIERHDHTSVVYNGYVYVLGGWYADFYNDVQYAQLQF
jgi:hypothetical protein